MATTGTSVTQPVEQRLLLQTLFAGEVGSKAYSELGNLLGFGAEDLKSNLSQLVDFVCADIAISMYEKTRQIATKSELLEEVELPTTLDLSTMSDVLIYMESYVDDVKKAAVLDPLTDKASVVEIGRRAQHIVDHLRYIESFLVLELSGFLPPSRSEDEEPPTRWPTRSQYL